MTKRQKQAKFSAMLGMLLVKAATLKAPVVILELYRTMETQRQYVARGVSKTLTSDHIDGLAADLAFLSDIEDDGKLNYTPDKYLELGLYWESIGGEWGGRYGEKDGKGNGWDSGHFGFKG